VLIGCFTVLVSLLGLVFGAAVVFVVLAFSLLRLLIAFVDGWLTAFAGQSQQATRVYPFRRGASRASLP
jgi:Na+/H+-dicarboxylate symporter